MKKIYMVGHNDTDSFCVKHKRTAKRMVHELNKNMDFSFNDKSKPFWYKEFPVVKDKDINTIESNNGMWYSKHGYTFK